ncbi:unnamed protein product, partial [Mesorhabditis spiculigera]
MHWLGELRALWRSRVDELIEKITDNFTTFFKKMGWRGEVELIKPEDTNRLDVEKYGIGINVSFREHERMRRLDDKTQSGGERSVSTILYLFALQELCPVPFRCVDEINQGMDPKNERAVFNMMVDLLCNTGTLKNTQYFLLTPKLLRGLDFGDKVTPHIVHNSPMLPEDVLKWDHHDFIGRL